MQKPPRQAGLKALQDLIKLPGLVSHKLADWQIKVIQEWTIIAGDLSNQTRVERVTRDTIFLGVYDTAWMQELHLLSSLICEKINTYIGQNCVKQIRLKYVERKKNHSIRPLKPEQPINYQLSTSERRALQKIVDPELRLAMELFRKRCHGD